MFFILSKVLGYLLQPSALLVIALVFGSILLFTRWQRPGKWLTTICSLTFAIILFTPVSFMALAPLEYRIGQPAEPAKIDGIVVLGGALDNLISRSRGKTELYAGGDRVTEAAILARKHPDAKILFSGSANWFGNAKQSEADFASRFLQDLGVDQSRILIESKARNTHENAIYSRALVTPKPSENWVLITSAFHMPRSYSLFRNAGWADIIPWPVDFRTRGWADRKRISTASRKHIDNFDVAVREYLGLLAYWITGRTDELWPKR